MPIPPDQKSQLEISLHPRLHEASHPLQNLNSIAQELVDCFCLEELSPDRLALIVNAAQEVKHQLFLAALEDPTASELESIAEDFIHRALTSGRDVQ